MLQLSIRRRNKKKFHHNTTRTMVGSADVRSR
jgi:hypothetical protein